MQEKHKLHFNILDSIRGIAALYVAIAHCRGVLWVGGSEFMRMFPVNTWDVQDYLIFGSSMLTRLAVEFVIVFFVLSGFSITHSLSANTSIWNFYKKRFIRIYPSYLIALVWAGFIFVLTKSWHPEWYDGSLRTQAFIRTNQMNNFFEPEVIFKNIFYLSSQGFLAPFWSLTYEVIFYLLAPFLLKRSSLYIVISGLLFLLNFLFPSIRFKLGLPQQIHDFIFIYNVYFAVGVFLYMKYETISGWLSGYSKIEFLIIIGGFLIIIYGANIILKIESAFTFIEAAMLSSVLIIFFLKYELRIPLLMKIGQFSYSLYISHFASIFLYLGIYWLIFEPTTPYIINYFVWIPAIFFVLLMGWIQYWLVERRTKSILEILRRNPSPRLA